MSDLINRQAAIDLIKKDKIELVEPYITIYRETGTLYGAETQIMTCDRHIEMIKGLPTADVLERKRGEWIKFDEGNTVCSLCGFELEDWTQGIFYRFCPNCGSEMMEVEHE